MPLSRWLALIALLVGVGFLQVGQRNAIVLNAYAVGAGMRQVHAKETDVSWLDVEVTHLASPSRLAEVARERRLKLVARPTLSAMPPLQLAAGNEVAD